MPAAPDDAVAHSVEACGQEALAAMPAALRDLPRDEVPLRGFDMVGLPALRALLRPGDAIAAPASAATAGAPPDLPGLDRLVDELAAKGTGLVMVMGKGGVGKTTVAAALRRRPGARAAMRCTSAPPIRRRISP